MNTRIKLIAIAGVLLLTAFSCSRNIPEPVSPPINDNIPPKPANFTASVGDRMAFLTWSISDTQNISIYRIYQSDSDSLHFRVVAEVTQTSYAANNLHNGITYYFKVAAVNNSGFEGYSSDMLSTVPDLYGIIINDGARYTNDRNVGLTMVAPTGTRYMQVSNDSTFAGNPWENYVLTKIWELTAGDQTKAVFVKYRNHNDEITSTYYSANITLDTHAAIDSITFTPESQPYVAGELVHFKLFAEESEGQARTTVGQGLINLTLYDDGSRGDAVSGDGIYECDYIIAGNLDFANATVYGNFTDRASNTAQQIQARRNMSVTRAPDPVTIFGIVPPTGFFDRLQINWNATPASDFAQYRVYRALSANVDSSDYLVEVISQISITSLTDTGLTANTVYYYKVYVVDNTGLWAGSNEVHASTNANLPPDPVVLFPPVALPGTHDRLSLSWSASHDQDFLRYELYRSYDNNVTVSDILILASATQTTAVDSNLAADSAYYYRVQIMDRAGDL
ncbi:MAG TPA: hypothetical protein DCZ43_06980, partial [candidate division Zixibacteria bacterium]|nr:hypothetical protein [candidate division Zixibacteria bacterium]